MSTRYPVLRSALRPEYAEATDDVVESVVAQLYGAGMSAEDAESFLSGIGNAFNDFGRGVANVARQAAPVLGNALPGALSGAATGAALGPWGALAGAVLGGVTSAISAGNAPGGGAPRPAPHPPMHRPAPHAGGAGAAGAIGQFAGIAGPALQGLAGMGGTAGLVGRVGGMALPAVQALASGDTRGGIGQLVGAAGQMAGQAAPGGIGGQIAGLLGRPEVQQAITSQLLGPYGRDQVSVGGMPVPTGAVMNMLSSLFGQAASQRMGAPGESEAMPAYLLDHNGEFVVDPADPDARGQWLAQVIASTPRPDPARRRPVEAAYQDAWDEGGYDEAYDEGYDELDEGYDEVDVAYSVADLDEHDESDEGYDEAVSYRFAS